MKKLKIQLAMAFAFATTMLCAQQQTQATDSLATKQKTLVKEYGIGFTSLNNYSLQYRWGNPKLLYRINANIGFTGLLNNNNLTDTYNQGATSYSSTSNNTQVKTPVNINTAVGFSMFGFKQISQKFGFITGGAAGLTYSYTTAQTTVTTSNYSTGNIPQSEIQVSKTTTQILQPYIGCVLGAYYKITPSFIVYAEITPNVYFATTITNGTTTYTENPTNFNHKSSDLRTRNSNLGISGLTNSGAMLTLAYRITK